MEDLLYECVCLVILCMKALCQIEINNFNKHDSDADIIHSIVLGLVISSQIPRITFLY